VSIEWRFEDNIESQIAWDWPFQKNSFLFFPTFQSSKLFIYLSKVPYHRSVFSSSLLVPVASNPAQTHSAVINTTQTKCEASLFSSPSTISSSIAAASSQDLSALTSEQTSNASAVTVVIHWRLAFQE
jgi:hypothetical protein